MTRPKVPPDQRQRTAQACESCKRRKQKCNGLCPCNTCEKRKFTCTYIERDNASSPDGAPALKRRETTHPAVDASVHARHGPNEAPSSATPFNGQSALSPRLSRPPQVPSPQRPQLTPATSEANVRLDAPAIKSEDGFKREEDPPSQSMEAAARSLQQFAAGTEGIQHPGFMSRGGSTQSGPEEEAVVYSQTRMLQDPTGRLLYLGDSASLSFLQLLRMMVENVSGTSPFTSDPRRHKIMETQFSLPANTRHTHLLPDKRTAYVLVDSFFINTHGLIQVFEQQAFLNTLESCYSDPLSTEPHWLCLLNMVFAIGLMLATPKQGTAEGAVVDKLRSEHLDRAEIFYLNAKSLNDPLTGFEDADFWSIQALLLMAVYMLAKSKRNTAFALLGMAVRSAYALGLHREETMIIFGQDEQTSRRNLWRSLFVLDRFLSCSLGRPAAISEDDCSGNTLRPAHVQSEGGDAFGFNAALPANASFSQTSAFALDAAVRSCSVIGTILKRVYQQRKISTRLAQEIADVCKMWPKALAPILHWKQASTASPSQGIAILHVNLIYCHSIVLLTRPFFLYMLNAETQKEAAQAHNAAGVRAPRGYGRMEKFSDACAIASTHTIVLVRNAFEAGYLPRRNPVVIYFLFAAALVLLANEFAALYNDPAGDACVRTAISIMNYCAESDPQASRLVYILSTFRDVVNQQKERRKQRQQQQAQTSIMASHSPTQIYPPVQNHQFSPSAGQMPPPMQQMAQHPPTVTPTGAQQSPQADHPMQHAPETLYANPSHSPAINTAAMPTLQPPSNAPTPSGPPPNAISPNTITSTPTIANAQPLDPNQALTNLMDLSALEGPRVPSIHSEESSGPDEHIEFDALWAWPSNTPAVGSPRYTGDVQGISDSAVPLFGVMNQ